MAEAVHRVRNIFEGEDRVSDDIRRVERGLGDLEDQSTSFGDTLRGPAGLIAGMYLTEEALQNLIEGYHELAITLAEEGVPAAQAYIASTDAMQTALGSLGETVVEVTGGPIAGILNALSEWITLGAIAQQVTIGGFKAIAEYLRGGDIADALEETRDRIREISEGGFEALGPEVPIETTDEERRIEAVFSRLREENESVEGQVESLSGRIRNDLVPSMELVGIVGPEALELVSLTAEDTEISLSGVASTVAESLDEVLIPALDRVIDKLFEASGAGDFFGDVIKGAVAGFAFGGPLGGVIGAGVEVIEEIFGRKSRDDDVVRG